MRARLVCALTAVAICIACGSRHAYSFQIGPLGTKFEEKLTNEPTSSRAKIAGKLGRLIKGPVHEEITQLAHACPTDLKDLLVEKQCASADATFVNPFVIYGVRWNDLPPFLLRPHEGRRCKKVITGGAACNVSQTVRFSTQPDCWYCIFQASEKIASSGRKIVGCLPAVREKGARFFTASLLSRSHFGDLQFLHSMAHEDNVDPDQTRREILGWLQFAWQVATREIAHDTLLRAVNIAALQDRFRCSGWSVSDLYILGRKDKMLNNIDDVAFGSLLHTVQDSFAEGHANREAPVANETCSATVPLARPGRILEFHGYPSQDGHLHDARDAREAMVEQTSRRWPEAVEASQQLVNFYRRRAKWSEVEPYAQCLFTLSANSRRSSPGDEFRRR